MTRKITMVAVIMAFVAAYSLTSALVAAPTYPDPATGAQWHEIGSGTITPSTSGLACTARVFTISISDPHPSGIVDVKVEIADPNPPAPPAVPDDEFDDNLSTETCTYEFALGSKVVVERYSDVDCSEDSLEHTRAWAYDNDPTGFFENKTFTPTGDPENQNTSQEAPDGPMPPSTAGLIWEELSPADVESINVEITIVITITCGDDTCTYTATFDECFNK